MRALKMVFSLTAIFLLTSLTFSFGQDIQIPDIDISDNTWDFGEVKEGDILEHVFILRNDSTEVLHINNVDTSCGCTASEVTEKNIPSGGATEIKVKFDTKGYSGEVKQFVFVNTGSLDTPVIQFVIKADVQSGG